MQNRCLVQASPDYALVDELGRPHFFMHRILDPTAEMNARNTPEITSASIVSRLRPLSPGRNQGYSLQRLQLVDVFPLLGTSSPMQPSIPLENRGIEPLRAPLSSPFPLSNVAAGGGAASTSQLQTVPSPFRPPTIGKIHDLSPNSIIGRAPTNSGNFGKLPPGTNPNWKQPIFTSFYPNDKRPPIANSSHPATASAVLPRPPLISAAAGGGAASTSQLQTVPSPFRPPTIGKIHDLSPNSMIERAPDSNSNFAKSPPRTVSNGKQPIFASFYPTDKQASIGNNSHPATASAALPRPPLISAAAGGGAASTSQPQVPPPAPAISPKNVAFSILDNIGGDQQKTREAYDEAIYICKRENNWEGMQALLERANDERVYPWSVASDDDAIEQVPYNPARFDNSDENFTQE